MDFDLKSKTNSNIKYVVFIWARTHIHANARSHAHADSHKQHRNYSHDDLVRIRNWVSNEVYILYIFYTFHLYIWCFDSFFGLFFLFLFVSFFSYKCVFACCFDYFFFSIILESKKEMMSLFDLINSSLTQFWWINEIKSAAQKSYDSFLCTFTFTRIVFHSRLILWCHFFPFISFSREWKKCFRMASDSFRFLTIPKNEHMFIFLMHFEMHQSDSGEENSFYLLSINRIYMMDAYC